MSRRLPVHHMRVINDQNLALGRTVLDRVVVGNARPTRQRRPRVARNCRTPPRYPARRSSATAGSSSQIEGSM